MHRIVVRFCDRTRDEIASSMEDHMHNFEREDDLIELGAVSEETRGVGDTAWEDREPLYFSVEAA